MRDKKINLIVGFCCHVNFPMRKNNFPCVVVDINMLKLICKNVLLSQELSQKKTVSVYYTQQSDIERQNP